MQVFHSTHLAAGRRVKYAAPIMEKRRSCTRRRTTKVCSVIGAVSSYQGDTESADNVTLGYSDG